MLTVDHELCVPIPSQENIPDAVITKIQPYIDNEDFTPAAIAKVSKACTSICQWARAMHKYHFVAKGVEPKRVCTYVTIIICYRTLAKDMCRCTENIQ